LPPRHPSCAGQTCPITARPAHRHRFGHPTAQRGRQSALGHRAGKTGRRPRRELGLRCAHRPCRCPGPNVATVAPAQWWWTRSQASAYASATRPFACSFHCARRIVAAERLDRNGVSWSRSRPAPIADVVVRICEPDRAASDGGPSLSNSTLAA
jgi:hypothetical protein